MATPVLVVALAWLRLASALLVEAGVVRVGGALAEHLRSQVFDLAQALQAAALSADPQVALLAVGQLESQVRESVWMGWSIAVWGLVHPHRVRRLHRSRLLVAEQSAPWSCWEFWSYLVAVVFCRRTEPNLECHVLQCGDSRWNRSHSPFVRMPEARPLATESVSQCL